MQVLRQRSRDLDITDERPLHDFLNLIYIATSKLIAATREYSLLSELPTSDQMNLLKGALLISAVIALTALLDCLGAVSEMLFLWSVFALDQDRKYWLLPCIEVSARLHMLHSVPSCVCDVYCY